MPPQKRKKFQIPKSLLEMKFMKKTKENEERLREDADRQAMFSNEITEQMMSDGQRIITEASLVPLLGLVEGRFSFYGINPEIERIMESEEAAANKDQKVDEEAEKSVLDEDMADTLGKSMNRKFMPKRQRRSSDNGDLHNKKFKFLKPADD